MAPDNQNAAPSWPPRSPHEALLSTPKGRQRYREMMNQISPTSSPSQRRSRVSLASPPENMQIERVEEEDEDEDEETLQLKLQEIQARLKLKRLQRAKGKEMAGGASKRVDENVPSVSNTSSSLPQRSARLTTPDMDNKPLPASQPMVEVPASPVRRGEPPLPPKSPSRVLLGIDKGLKAKDISLKRAPSFRRPVTVSDATTSKSGLLNRSKSFSCDTLLDTPRPRSFNERIASARTEEVFRAKRQERIQKLRSNTFGIGKEEMEEYKKQAVEIPDEPLMNRSFTREEITGKSRSNSSSGTLTSSQTAPSLRSSSGTSNNSDSTNITSSDPKSSSMTIDSLGDSQSTSFETYSSFHLSKRIIPHTVLARHVSGKKIFCIKDLLRTVKAPDFALPDIEQDIVVFAIIAKKSEPRAHKPTAAKNGQQQQDDTRRYMVLNLVDLEYELDLFLFNTGFNRYWKLTEGTVVAILNPNVMPPSPGRQDTGRFGLVINSDEDTILEIGTARDLGFCQAIKKDGDLCSAWVNKRRTQFCEFHSNEAIRKQRSTRMEVNSQGFGGRDRFKPQQQQQQQQTAKDPFVFGQNNKKKPDNYDWETKSHWFVSKTHSAADLIDGKDRSAADRKEKAEFLQRSMEAKEREREMMKKLGKIGHAAGKEYMQRSGSQGSATGRSSTASLQASLVPTDTADEPVRPGIASLVLDKDREIHLSPIKRKRTGSSNAGSIVSSASQDNLSNINNNKSKNSSSNSSNSNNNNNNNNNNGRKTTGFGWGSDLKIKLSSMRDGEKLKPEQPPLRKKTRFVTDKGIRVAGRDSLGELAKRQILLGNDDDDDELVIVN